MLLSHRESNKEVLPPRGDYGKMGVAKSVLIGGVTVVKWYHTLALMGLVVCLFTLREGVRNYKKEGARKGLPWIVGSLLVGGVCVAVLVTLYLE